VWPLDSAFLFYFVPNSSPLSQKEIRPIPELGPIGIVFSVVGFFSVGSREEMQRL